MKTYTKHHKNLRPEIIATEQKLRRQQWSKFRPRKWLGNTLVPVIIALAISALATIAFLTQGANLSTKNKVLVAQNEIASLISEWNVAKEALGGKDKITTSIFPSNNSTYEKTINFSAAVAASGGNSATPPKMTYDTESTQACKSLASKISTKQEGVDSTPTCNGTTLTISLK
jgi:hypothetical protein